MIRAPVALALLAASWLFGLGYYQPADPLAWTVLVVSATLLLAGMPSRMPSGTECYVSLALLAPAIYFMPWPFRAAPLLCAVGLCLMQLPPADRRWAAAAGWGAVKAGVVLLVQSLAMLGYAAETARSHDLPEVLASGVAGACWLLGADSAYDAPALAIHSVPQVHRLAATWELVLDPATFCFYIGGLVLLGLLAYDAASSGRRWNDWIRQIRVFTLLVVAWLPVRVGLLVGLYLHRAVTADPSEPPVAMNQFVSPWLLLGILLGPVLLCWRFLRIREGQGWTVDSGRKRPENDDRPPSTIHPRPELFAAVLVLVAVGLISFLVEWEPVGRPKAGRIMVVERHSTWEPTTKRYNTTDFGELASYNYGAIYDYCSRFFQMSQLLEEDSINRQTLDQCDVLVIKIPGDEQRRESFEGGYQPAEVEAIRQFVERGGGLLTIGDHTDVFLSSTHLNDVVRPYGFQFRHDVLFRIGSPYVELHQPEAIPHPIVQHLPPMHFAGSCSIDPGGSLGRAVVETWGMWSLPPDYHSENFFPQAEYRPEMRYGSFIQAWATRYGRGRVLAFADSTMFSSFSTFEPGKAELLLGMLDWLNRRSVFDSCPARLTLTIPLLLVALAALLAALLLAAGHDSAWVVLVTAGACGWAIASLLVVAVHRRAMPEPRPVRPLETVVIDRTVSDVPLCRGGFIQGDGRGYGLFEQWIPRLGCFTTRRSGDQAFDGDALVVLCPTRSVSEEFRQGVVQYVAAGGKLLVVDSLDVVGSTANSLLWPFGLSSDHATAATGKLGLLQGWPDIELAGSCQITGGEPFMWAGAMPVASRTTYGKGSVMAIGFGSLLNDENMGRTWMLEPDADTLLRYNVLFALVRGLLGGQPVVAPAPAITGQP